MPTAPSQIEGEAFKVFIRIRPVDTHNDCGPDLGQGRCLQVNTQENRITINSKPDAKFFTFDHVADCDTTQEAVFSAVGKPMIESCMSGYNATIFAYGQTGSGKTFTMLGPPEDSESFKHEIRGVIPRGLEYLFGLIKREAEMIYNERVYDLLDPVSSGLTVRENMKLGVFVDGVIEETVTSAADAYRVLNSGWINRKVAFTSMNRESSRSHAVFSMIIESKTCINHLIEKLRLQTDFDNENEGGLQRVRSSRLNLVDLAGSERQRDAKTTGLRLKEATTINQSLSTLGNVIMSLGKVAQGRSQYIPYRDSKLTFLLKDSLGGNAKTQLIACVHPHHRCFGETLSTLQFAQRAKLIKNKAVINVNTEGNIAELEAEIRLLRAALSKLSPGGIAPISSLSHTPETGDDSEWKLRFVQAMHFLQREQKEKQVLETNVRHLKDTIGMKNKALMTSNMVIKFRVSDIDLLKKSAHAPLTDDHVNQRIANLESEVRLWREANDQHKDCGQLLSEVARLKGEATLLRTTQDIERCTRNNAELAARLNELYDELVENGVAGDAVMTCSACRKHTDNISNLSREVSELKLKLQEEQDRAKKQRLCLESEASCHKKMAAELEKILSNRQRKNDIERRTMNDLHLQTIKNITTPTQLRYNLRSRTAPSQESPVFAVITPDPFSPSPGLTLADEPPPKEITDGLNEEIRVLQESNSNLQTMLENQEHTTMSLKQKVISLTSHSEKLEETLGAERLKWSAKEEELSKDVEAIQSERDRNRLLAEEVSDLRVMLAAAEKLVNERDASIEMAGTKRIDLELQLTEIEKNNQIISEERDALQESLDNVQATLGYTEDQVASLETRLTKEIASHKECQSQLESVTLKLDQESDRCQQLQVSQGHEQEHQIQKLLSQLAVAHDERDSVRGMVEFQSQQLISYNTELNVTTSTLNAQQKLLAENKEVITSLTEKIHELKVRLDDSNDRVSSLGSQLADQCSLLESHATTRERQVARIASLESALDELNGQIERERCSSEVTASIRQDELDYTIECRDQLQAEVSQMSALLDQCKAELAQSHQTTDRLQSELNLKGEEIEQLNAHSDSFHTPKKDNLSELYDMIQARDNQIATTSNLAELQELLKVEEKTWADKNAELQAVKNELEREVSEKLGVEQRASQLESHAADVEHRCTGVRAQLEAATKQLDVVLADKNEYEERCTRLEMQLAVDRVREETVRCLQDEVDRFRHLAENDLREKNELQSRVETLAERYRTLEDSYHALETEHTQLVGHCNLKQKIHYHMQLKEELNAYKQKCELQQMELSRYKTKSTREPLMSENIDPNK